MSSVSLQIASDLHFEMHADKGKSFIESMDPADVDVLVLAGDITMARFYESLKLSVGTLAAKYPHVVYVTGNHEYYKASSKQVHHNLTRLVAEFSNVYWLNNSVATIAGVRFFGGTMWFKNDPLAAPFKSYMNDFDTIEDFEPWVYEQNAAFEAAAQREIDDKTVVVTHHLPAPQSIAPQYARSALNAFFLHDMSNLIAVRKPPLWAHGHTHSPCDYVLGSTRVVCNPFGYPRERPAGEYRERLLIDVDA